MALTGPQTDSVFRRYDIVSAIDLKDAARRLDEVANLRRELTPAVILRMRYRALGLFHQVSRPLIAMTTVRAPASDTTILLGMPSTSPV